jgi:hypothetical protein
MEEKEPKRQETSIRLPLKEEKKMKNSKDEEEYPELIRSNHDGPETIIVKNKEALNLDNKLEECEKKIQEQKQQGMSFI